MSCIGTFVICINFMNYIGGLCLIIRKEMAHKHLNELILEVNGVARIEFLDSPISYIMQVMSFSL